LSGEGEVALAVAERSLRPRTADDVLAWLSAGRISIGEALAHFQRLETAPRGAVPAAASDPLAEARAQLAAVMGELDDLIGLAPVKELVRELRAFVEIQQRRAQEGLCSQTVALHMIFRGNPGTGKTTVARLLGRMFHALGVLPRGHLIECERADLVGEYIGHTAQRTREHIRKAMGGVLFIDEAYALARGGEKDFGKEAIDTLVKAMEDHKDQLIVILAGYRDEMEHFLSANPGLRSRFPLHMDFPDYTPAELFHIAQRMCRERQYRLSTAAAWRLERLLQQRVPAGPCNGNARYVRNLIERAIRRQALRLVGRRNLSRDDLLTLEASDVLEAVLGGGFGAGRLNEVARA